jgi:hypothetical protein
MHQVIFCWQLVFYILFPLIEQANACQNLRFSTESDINKNHPFQTLLRRHTLQGIADSNHLPIFSETEKELPVVRDNNFHYKI